MKVLWGVSFAALLVLAGLIVIAAAACDLVELAWDSSATQLRTKVS